MFLSVSQVHSNLHSWHLTLQLTRVLWDELMPQLEQQPKASRQATQLWWLYKIGYTTCVDSTSMSKLAQAVLRTSGHFNATGAICLLSGRIICWRTCAELRLKMPQLQYTSFEITIYNHLHTFLIKYIISYHFHATYLTCGIPIRILESKSLITSFLGADSNKILWQYSQWPERRSAVFTKTFLKSLGLGVTATLKVVESTDFMPSLSRRFMEI